MEPVVASNDPPGYVWLTKLLPTTIMINTFANFFTLLISVGAYGPAGHFWSSFEVFITLAWLFFLIALTLGIVASMILTYQRHYVIDAFRRGRNGGLGSKSWIERCAVALVVKVPLGLVIVVFMLLGFLFCSLCVSSHCLAVGWIGFVWALLMMVLAIVAWVWMEHA